MSNMEKVSKPFSLSSNDLELKMLVSILVLISCSSKKFQLKTSTLFGFNLWYRFWLLRLYQTLKSTMTFTSIRLKGSLPGFDNILDLNQINQRKQT